jgi:hypothetical protein
MAKQDTKGFRRWVYKRSASAVVLSYWPMTDEGRVAFERTEPPRAWRALEAELPKTDFSRRPVAGEASMYEVVEHAGDSNFFYDWWLDHEAKTLYDGDRDRTASFEDRLSLLFHRLRHADALVRITTTDSHLYGRPWGAVARVRTDRFDLAFASSPADRPGQTVEIRYFRIVKVEQIGLVDRDATDPYEYEEYIDENGSLARGP